MLVMTSAFAELSVPSWSSSVDTLDEDIDRLLDPGQLPVGATWHSTLHTHSGSNQAATGKVLLLFLSDDSLLQVH